MTARRSRVPASRAPAAAWRITIVEIESADAETRWGTALELLIEASRGAPGTGRDPGSGRPSRATKKKPKRE